MPLGNAMASLSEASKQLFRMARVFRSSQEPEEQSFLSQPASDDIELQWTIGGIPQGNVVCGQGGLQQKAFTPQQDRNAISLALDRMQQHGYNYPKRFYDSYDPRWFPACDPNWQYEIFIGAGAADDDPRAYRIIFEYLATGLSARYCGIVYHQNHLVGSPFARCV
ncbi:unnamed protein product [Fusarium graminearum]|nr:unnamed protein product [Fusarium graminearum]